MKNGCNEEVVFITYYLVRYSSFFILPNKVIHYVAVINFIILHMHLKRIRLILKISLVNRISGDDFTFKYIKQKQLT